MSPDLAHLKEMHERAERLREEAAEAEGAAFVCWQEAYGTYEVINEYHRAA